MRWTKLCNGRNRSTYSIPSTRLAYITESSGNKQSSPKQDTQDISDENYNLEYEASTELEGNQAEYDDFIKEVNKVKLSHKVWKIGMWLTILLGIMTPPFFIATILLLIVRKCCRKYFEIELNYNFDTDFEDYFACLNLFLSELASSSRLWRILRSYHEENTKYSSGAASTFARTLTVVLV